MLSENEWTCPVCGLVLHALTAYHHHWVKEHQVVVTRRRCASEERRDPSNG